jgi:hypothetical protein
MEINEVCFFTNFYTDSVKYRVIRIRNPFRKAEEGKFYPVPVSKGRTILEEVATTVSRKTVLSTKDVIATIDALLYAIPEYLRLVRFLGFSFPAAGLGFGILPQ